MLLPNPRTLQLSDGVFSDVSSFLQLNQLGSLTELRLERIRIEQSGTEPSTQAKNGLGQAVHVQQLLQSMQQLASLTLLSIKMDQGSISQLPSSQLPAASLTHLSLYGLMTGGEWETESCLARSITQLPQLQELLENTHFYPTVLASMPQLHKLVLRKTNMLPRAAEAADTDHPGEADFLSAVASLRRLRHLESHCCLTWPLASTASAVLRSNSLQPAGLSEGVIP
jgi:hypothetical protein